MITKVSFLLCTLCMCSVACESEINLNSLQLNIWQPTGASYFDESGRLTAHLQTNSGYQKQFDGPANNFTMELADLQLADTSIQVDLTLTNVGVDYVGASDWLPLTWPEDETSPQQEPALIFMGPKNEIAPISTVYPHDGDIITCMGPENQLVMGSSLGNWQEQSTDVHFLDYNQKSLANGPIFSNTPTNAACALDPKNILWVYGGCDDSQTPTGGLQKAPLNEQAVIQNIDQQPTRTSCFSDLWAGQTLLWLSEGKRVEARERDGNLLASWSTDTTEPMLHFVHTHQEDRKIWLVEGRGSSFGKLYLLSYDDQEITEDSAFFEDELVTCTAGQQNLILCLTSKGLYSIDDQLRQQEVLADDIIAQAGFEPVIFAEARPGHWVFVNATGDQIRIVQNDQIKDITPQKNRPHSRLFRGPGGALFWVGGNQKGIDLLVTHEL